VASVYKRIWSGRDGRERGIYDATHNNVATKGDLQQNVRD
jgi:hypothetical protein